MVNHDYHRSRISVHRSSIKSASVYWSLAARDVAQLLAARLLERYDRPPYNVAIAKQFQILVNVLKTDLL